MSTLTVPLPDPLRNFVEEQTASGGYTSQGEYVLALIQEAQRREQEQLEMLLLEGLDSGPGIEVTPEYWQRKRAQLLERHQPLG